jgi:peroxiredoxin
MAIKQGDKVPEGIFKEKTPDGIKDVTTKDLFGGKKVVLFAVPGAFTPTCSAKHLPGFVGKAVDLRSKGIDEIACMSVNDAFVMDAWGLSQNVTGKVRMLADGNGTFAKAMGLELDATKGGLGMRSQRFAMVVEDGTITKLNVEAPGAFEVSSAEYVLSQL